MKSGSIHITEVYSSYQSRIKPTFFLNKGRRAMIDISKKGGVSGCINDIVSNVYRPGIFKRIFISDLSHGKKYITASSMLSQDAAMFSKILSVSQTENLEPMILRPKQVLFSCAGSIGDTRLIGSDLDGVVGSQDIIRVVPKDSNYGFVYAYLSSPTVYEYIQSLVYGSVVSRIEPEAVSGIPLISIPSDAGSRINELIKQSFDLRNEANSLLGDSNKLMLKFNGLEELDRDEFDYFGARTVGRQLATTSISIKDIGTTSFNAFCHSRRINQLRNRIPNSVKIKDVLVGGDTFSTGSFPRVEVKEGNGVMLINQSDIFDTIIKGKWISKRKVNLANNLVSYGEVLVAGVGTLGENETFCRALFANEDLVGQLISGEFIRMKCNEKMPSGYLFTWLNSDYGFRLIRSTHSGTKLCRPIPALFLQIPVPVLDKDKMDEIDLMVRTAFTKRHKANNLEKEAIQMVENEIDKWNNN